MMMEGPSPRNFWSTHHQHLFLLLFPPYLLHKEEDPQPLPCYLAHSNPRSLVEMAGMHEFPPRWAGNKQTHEVIVQKAFVRNANSMLDTKWCHSLPFILSIHLWLLIWPSHFHHPMYSLCWTAP